MTILPPNPEEMLTERAATIAEQWPTLDSAWGCENCRALFRTAPNARCPHCGSESVFDLLAAIMRPVVALDKLRPLVDALERELATGEAAAKEIR